MSLKNKTALVTGGSRGIGRAISSAMARKGVKVAVNHFQYGSADDVLREIEEDGGVAVGFKADISRENEVKAMVEGVLGAFGRIDFLINNAGIADQFVPLMQEDTDRWQKVIDIHLKGTYLCSKESARSMIENKFGRIVNISSIAGVSGFPWRTAYGPAKSGIINLTKVLAIELAPFNINVNAIAPGYIRTDAIANLSQAGKLNEDKIINRIPLKRFGTPEEIAETVPLSLFRRSELYYGNYNRCGWGMDRLWLLLKSPPKMPFQVLSFLPLESYLSLLL